MRIDKSDEIDYIDPVTGIKTMTMPLPPSMEGWVLCQAMYPDYYSAAVWAMLIEERWAAADETKVIGVDRLHMPFPEFMKRRRD